jgi:hypothetical protein
LRLKLKELVNKKIAFAVLKKLNQGAEKVYMKSIPNCYQKTLRETSKCAMVFNSKKINFKTIHF